MDDPVVIQLGSSILAYVVYSLLLYLIANKLGHESAWLAWVPLINLFLMCDLAGKSWLWMLLLCVPLVNIIVIIMLWMNIAEARGKASLWGILAIVPVGNLVMMLYLALSE